MGFLDKIKGMVNPDTIDDNYDDDYVFDEGEDNAEYGYDEYPQQQQPQQQNSGGYQQHPQQRPQNQQYQAPMNNQQGGMGINSANNLELRLIRPERYDSVRPIADHLLNRRTVVLNVEAMNKEDARKMIEFLTGVIYSIGGGLQRAADNTFVLTPNNVDMSEEKRGNQKMSRDMFNN